MKKVKKVMEELEFDAVTKVRLEEEHRWTALVEGD